MGISLGALLIMWSSWLPGCCNFIRENEKWTHTWVQRLGGASLVEDIVKEVSVLLLQEHLQSLCVQSEHWERFLSLPGRDVKLPCTCASPRWMSGHSSKCELDWTHTFSAMTSQLFPVTRVQQITVVVFDFACYTACAFVLSSTTIQFKAPSVSWAQTDVLPVASVTHGTAVTSRDGSAAVHCSLHTVPTWMHQQPPLPPTPQLPPTRDPLQPTLLLPRSCVADTVSSTDVI